MPTLNNINGALVLVEVGLVLWLFYACFQKTWGEPLAMGSPCSIWFCSRARLSCSIRSCAPTIWDRSKSGSMCCSRLPAYAGSRIAGCSRAC